MQKFLPVLCPSGCNTGGPLCRRHGGRISLGRTSVWRRLSHRPPKATSEWESPSPGNLQDMGVQLVGQDAHDAVGKLSESHRPEELDHAAWKEQPQDVPPQDDTIKATVFELDI